MMKLLCAILLLSILYEIDALTGRLLTEDTVFNENIFRNQTVVFLKGTNSTILKPTLMAMRPGIRIDFFRITYSYDLDFNHMSKMKLCEYSGSRLDRQYVFSENSGYLYALLLVNATSNSYFGRFQFQLKTSECSMDVEAEGNPILIYPGYSTSIDRYYSTWSYNTFNCTYRIYSKTNMKFEINQLVSNVHLMNFSVNGVSRYNLSPRNVSKGSSFIFSVHGSPGYRRSGMELNITSKPVKFSLDADGSVLIHINSQTYFWQVSQHSSEDLHNLCREMGFATWRSNSSRLAQPGEKLLAHKFYCYYYYTSLEQCRQINTTGLHYLHYYDQPHLIATVQCQADISLKYDQQNKSVSAELNGQWYEICADGIDQYAANVVCSNLGYKMAATYTKIYGSRYRTFITYLRCMQEKKFKDCNFFRHNYCYARLRLTCADRTSISIIPGYHNRGLLTFMDQFICHDGFTKTTANVICNDLGYLGAISFEGVHNDSLPSNPKSYVRCSGTESNFGQCYINTRYNCSSNMAVNIFCQNIALVGSSKPNEGRVEVIYKGERGLLCDDSFNIHSGNVICRQLGFSKGARSASQNSMQYGHGNGRFTLDDLRCQGLESDINECTHTPWLSHNCGGQEISGLICSRPTNSTCIPNWQQIDYNIDRSNFHNPRYSFLVQIRASVALSPYWCAGTIIQDNWILTSASCFSLQKHYYYVTYANNPWSRYGISQWFIHPQYSRVTGENNLALLKVNSPVMSSSICMAPANDTDNIMSGSYCVTLGVSNISITTGRPQQTSPRYGNYVTRVWNNNGESSVMFQHVRPKNESQCVSDTNLRQDQIDKLFCSEAVTNRATGFTGQSGGPVFCRRPGTGDTLVGVMNKAIKANRPFANEVFTKVSKYSSWIQATVGAN